jgi:elongation factor P
LRSSKGRDHLPCGTKTAFVEAIAIFGRLSMAKARDLKKGSVVALEGGYWLVEEYHVQHAGRRRPVLHIKLRNLKTNHVVERIFDESDHLDEPEMETKRHQFLYEEQSGYVFMDAETFDQITVPADLIGKGRWLLKEGSEFPIRFVEGRVAEVVFPVNFIDEVVETASPSVAAHASNVVKEAKLACGLTISVPLFIKVGERVSVDTETHKYLGKG